MQLVPVSLIFQGLRNETHLAALQRLLRLQNAEIAILSVAYLTRGGVELIAADLATLGPHVSVFAGIRNGVTSKQGLSHLLEAGVTLFAIDTGARGVVYHPKLYLSRSATAAYLLVASANLTRGGLHNNIEAGVVFSLDLANPEERALQEITEAQFADIQHAYPHNVIPVTTPQDIDFLADTGRLIDEQTTTRVGSAVVFQPTDNVPPIPLAVPLRRPLAVPAQPAPPPATGVRELAQPWGLVTWQQVWESKPLTERDLGIPTGPTTNRTGSINLDKGLLPNSTDHRHYFRDAVFNALTWTDGRPGIEEATARFQLVVKDVAHGDFDLVLSHSTSTTSTTYRQRNAMTRLRWGQVRPFVAHRHLLERSLSLFRDRVRPTRFLLEID